MTREEILNLPAVRVGVALFAERCMVDDELVLRPGDREAARELPKYLDEEVAFGHVSQAAAAAPRLLAALEACEEMLALATELWWSQCGWRYRIGLFGDGCECSRRKDSTQEYLGTYGTWSERYIPSACYWADFHALWGALKAAGCTPKE